MGVRGEIFSTKVALQNRTYFFNVKENRLGDLYLNIVESKNRDEGGFERQSVILFAEDLKEFLGGFDESLKVLEKAYREKRRPIKREKFEDNSGNSSGPEGKSPRFKDERPFGNKPVFKDERGFRNKPGFKDKKGFKDNRESDSNKRFSDDSKPKRPKAYGQRKSQGAFEGKTGDSRRPKFRDDKKKEGERPFRSKDNKDFPPRKKRVVVKKR